MTRVGRPQIGTCDCAHCDERATVHQMKRSTTIPRYYYNCPACGCVQPTGKPAQLHIIRSFEPLEPGFEIDNPYQETAPPPDAEPDPEPDPEPDEQPKKRAGWFGDV